MPESKPCLKRQFLLDHNNKPGEYIGRKLPGNSWYSWCCFEVIGQNWIWQPAGVSARVSPKSTTNTSESKKWTKYSFSSRADCYRPKRRPKLGRFGWMKTLSNKAAPFLPDWTVSKLFFGCFFCRRVTTGCQNSLSCSCSLSLFLSLTLSLSLSKLQQTKNCEKKQKFEARQTCQMHLIQVGTFWASSVHLHFALKILWRDMAAAI